jgi:DNA-binding Xre family transcriptional regulator
MIADTIRTEILADGRTIYQLAQETGIDQSNIRAFIAGKRGMSLDALERLCEALKLQLRKASDNSL